MKKIAVNLIPIVVIAHLINALYYLSFSVEMKEAFPDAFSIWFFGSEFIFAGLLIALASREGKSAMDINFLRVAYVHFFLRAVLYILQYAHIITTNHRQRMSFLLGYMFIACIFTYTRRK